jgi:hypothetical protein
MLITAPRRTPILAKRGPSTVTFTGQRDDVAVTPGLTSSLHLQHQWNHSEKSQDRIAAIEPVLHLLFDLCKWERLFTSLKENVQGIGFVLVPSTSVVGDDCLSEVATKNRSESVKVFSNAPRALSRSMYPSSQATDCWS